MARTSSGEQMYLYTAPQWGLAFETGVGIDYQFNPHWGIRGVQFENQYLPFGPRGSVYWSIGAGITYRFRP
jgi:long-subunit fatty acid transport protein